MPVTGFYPVFPVAALKGKAWEMMAITVSELPRDLMKGPRGLSGSQRNRHSPKEARWACEAEGGERP